MMKSRISSHSAEQLAARERLQIGRGCDPLEHSRRRRRRVRRRGRRAADDVGRGPRTFREGPLPSGLSSSRPPASTLRLRGRAAPRAGTVTGRAARPSNRADRLRRSGASTRRAVARPRARSPRVRRRSSRPGRPGGTWRRAAGRSGSGAFSCRSRAAELLEGRGIARPAAPRDRSPNRSSSDAVTPTGRTARAGAARRPRPDCGWSPRRPGAPSRGRIRSASTPGPPAARSSLPIRIRCSRSGGSRARPPPPARCRRANGP